MRPRAIALGMALVAACSNGSRDEHETKTTQPLRVGFVPAARDQAARGAPAIAVDGGGHVFVLDAVNGRVLRKEGGELLTIAEVPRDADDLAIGPDGAIAVRRSVKPEVLVLDAGGRRVGVVDTSAVPDADGIALARSRRVIVTTPFQERFSLGSPAMPQLPAAILASKTEAPIAGVRTDDGELELRAGDARVSLGKGDAVRIVGIEGDVACARIEHVGTDTEGAVLTRREAACTDVRAKRTLFRRELPPPGAYLPRRELAFAGGVLAFARVTDAGVEISTWKIERGAR